MWSGKPNSKISSLELFSNILCVSIFVFGQIISLIHGIDYFFESGVIFNKYFLMFLIFLLISYLIIYIMIIEKKVVWKNTIYVVTDKRILVIIGGKYDRGIAKDFSEVTFIGIYKMSTEVLGRGTIVFGEVPYLFYHDRCMRYNKALKYSYFSNIPFFNDIDDVMKVYELV